MIVRVGFLSGLVTERRSIRHKQVLHIVCLAVPIQDRCLRIRSHARRTDFVNNLSACFNSKCVRSVDRCSWFDIRRP